MVIMAILKFLSLELIICIIFGSVSIDYSLVMGNILFYFFACLVSFDWMLDIVYFMLLGA